MADWATQTGGEPTFISVRPGNLDRIGVLLKESGIRDPCSQAILVTDETVARVHAPRVEGSIAADGISTCTVAVPPGEASKSLSTATEVYRFLAERRFGRDGVIVAVGGGVVSDLTGFVAATWMRGVRWIVCPTTVEGCVDAAIGGKTAVNVPGAKNLVGAFHWPAAVCIDPTCLLSLPKRDVSAGLAESIKHALVLDPGFVSWHERNVAAILRLEDSIAVELIERNVRLKLLVVERDPRETTGERMVLNFGHTIGHAIEEASRHELRHGECVALGMLAAGRLSQSMGILRGEVVDRLTTLLGRMNLPTRLPRTIDSEQVLAAIRLDKKNRGGGIRMVLLEDVGKPVVRDEVPEDSVREAYETLCR